MKAKTAAIGVAVLLVTAGVAAATPGNAPDMSNADESDDNYDGDAEQPDDARDDNESAEDEQNETEDAGPLAGVPEQVPDHVTEIHQLIN